MKFRQLFAFVYTGSGVPNYNDNINDNLDGLTPNKF